MKTKKLLKNEISTKNKFKIATKKIPKNLKMDLIPGAI